MKPTALPFAARDLRYLAAYSIPLTAGVGLTLGGAWTWLTPVYAFGLVPLVELLLGPRPTAPDVPATTAAGRGFFDWLLYLNMPLQYGLLLLFLVQLTTPAYAGGAVVAGAVVSMGICCGVLGINVAHELGHRPTKAEQLLARALLLSTLYLHFFIEHNRGHHRHVATPEDPATARLHEPFPRFFGRAVVGEYRSAWQLEQTRLTRQTAPFWSRSNQMLRFQAYQLLLLGAVGLAFGVVGVLGWLGAVGVGLVLFQLVNYVEHYGLLRRRTASGAYERVQPHHSWNSEHPLGRILLYELTRHSDHHYQAARPYHTLRFQPASPQMPTGYPGMMLLALVPPLWFRVMDFQLKSKN